MDRHADLPRDGPHPDQLSAGGSGAPVPDLSIEVDDVDEVHRRAREMGCKFVYDLTDEPWGVRRFFIADPIGKTLNVLSHLGWASSAPDPMHLKRASWLGTWSAKVLDVKISANPHTTPIMQPCGWPLVSNRAHFPSANVPV